MLQEMGTLLMVLLPTYNYANIASTFAKYRIVYYYHCNVIIITFIDKNYCFIHHRHLLFSNGNHYNFL